MVKPVDIIILTYYRWAYLKELIWILKERTDYPYRLIVVDNGTRGGCRGWIKAMAKKGEIWKYVFTKENLFMSDAFAEGFKLVESDLFIVTQDDLIPPKTKPCWLTKMVELINDNPEQTSISMAYRNISFERHLRNEFGSLEMIKDMILIPRYTSACGRIQRKDDFATFANIKGYRNAKTINESHCFGRFMRKFIKKKTGEATRITCQHLEAENKGYPKGFIDYKTYDKNYETKRKRYR